MRYLFVFLTFVFSFNSIAQSKKEQIAILTFRLDSLKREYIKDTTYLSNTVETIDREYTIMSMQYEEAQELIKKKSATISEKTNTILSLNEKNLELMEDLKELRFSLNLMKFEMKTLDSTLNRMRSSTPKEYDWSETEETEEYLDNDNTKHCYYRVSAETGEKITGIISSKYENGAYAFKFQYVNGLQCGLRQYWDEYGVLTEVEIRYHDQNCGIVSKTLQKELYNN